MQKCLFYSLMRAEPWSSRPLFSKVKIGGEKSKWKSPDAEGHVEATPGLPAPKSEA